MQSAYYLAPTDGMNDDYALNVAVICKKKESSEHFVKKMDNELLWRLITTDSEFDSH